MDENVGDADLATLTATGVVGFYNQFEVTELFAVQANLLPLNVFSILVAEDRLDAQPEAPRYLNTGPIKLKKLPEWNFGIKRYSCRVEEPLAALDELRTKGTWQLSGQTLRLGNLAPVPDRFVPPDSMDTVPLNRVLKNNFWNGSHLLEWADTSKENLQPLIGDAPQLQELSEMVQQLVPIHLASLSDRLGSVLVQFPVTALMTKLTKIRDSSDFFVKIAWHPKATPRRLRAVCEMDFDGVISGYASSDVRAPGARLRMSNGPGTHRTAIWDDEHRLILAATGPSAFASRVPFSLAMNHPEPRVFGVQDRQGHTVHHRVGLTVQTRNAVGQPQQDDTGGWTGRRIYKHERSRLTKERHFVQYNPKPGQEPSTHAKALGDVRFLVSQYGQGGAWLWDPFLSAHDVLETLFHCAHFGVDLRALTAGDQYGRGGGANLGKTFQEAQRAVLEAANCNLQGLRLEYRVRTGGAGWAFHDRFLIFPLTAERPAAAWSLGTSVNSLGTQHHILQRVDNGQRIVDAFEKLWSKLTSPQCLIWKKP